MHSCQETTPYSTGKVFSNGKPNAICLHSQVRLFTGIMFSDQPVQDEERIFGGRYKDIQVECDPPQKVVLDGEVSDHSRASPRPWQVLMLARSKHAQHCNEWPDSGPRIVAHAAAAVACATVLPAELTGQHISVCAPSRRTLSTSCRTAWPGAAY